MVFCMLFEACRIQHTVVKFSNLGAFETDLGQLTISNMPRSPLLNLLRNEESSVRRYLFVILH